jgi:hypothetical protein
MPMNPEQQANLIKEIRAFAKTISMYTEKRPNEYDLHLGKANQGYATNVSATAAMIVTLFNRIDKAVLGSPAAKVFSKQLGTSLSEFIPAVETYGKVAEQFGDNKETYSRLLTALKAAQLNFPLQTPAMTNTSEPRAERSFGGKM